MARGGALLFGLAAGVVTGWLVAERLLRQRRQDLFSPRPLRRFTALGSLAAVPGVETVRLLRDYVEWERHPVLRKRAIAIARRMEAALG